MSTGTAHRHRPDHGADPWWGEPQPTRADAPVAPPARRRRRAGRRRAGAGWKLLRLLAAPLVALGRRASRSPSLRRLGLRLAILLVIVTFLACSVGVILINNVVIGRTAELGELEDRRRELRRDNALLGAQAARLSAPPVVAGRARSKLGMERASELPRFLYLDPGSRRLTPLQRRRLAQRTARLRAQRAERVAAKEQRAPANSEGAAQ